MTQIKKFFLKGESPTLRALTHFDRASYEENFVKSSELSEWVYFAIPPSPSRSPSPKKKRTEYKKQSKSKQTKINQLQYLVKTFNPFDK